MKKGKRITTFVLAFILCVLNMREGAVQATNVMPAEEIRNEEDTYIVTLKDRNNYERTVEKYENNVIDEYCTYDSNIVTMELNDSEAAKLASEKGIVSIEENIPLVGLTEQDTKEATDNNQWYLDAIGMTDIQSSILKDGDNIKVEILDSGVSYTDDIDIVQRVSLIPGEDEVSPLYDDGSGHGTGIAGVLGAKDNGEGITGIHPNAEIYSVKVLDSGNTATLSRVIEGIYWGIENNVKIINMSFGTEINSPALHQAVKDAYEAGILLIAAGGNEGTGGVLYPAAYKEVMAVGSTGTDGKMVEDFAAGTELEVLAPGDKIVTTGLFDGMVTVEGTSISAAEVTAAASLLWSIDSSKSADFIRGLIRATGKSVENAADYNAGLLDVSRAVEVYEEYASQYQEGNTDDMEDVANTEEAGNFGNVGLVNGLWMTEKHADIVNDYLDSESTIGSDAYAKLNANRVSIMAATAKAADTAYGQGETSTLHGTGNYKKGLKYLYYCAQYVREGQSVTAASNNAFALVGTSEVEEVGKLKVYTESMLNSNIGGISSDQTDPAVRYFKVLGFALHCLQDTFAHRAIIQSNELGYFDSSDFTSSQWNLFNTDVISGGVEYRDVDEYTNLEIRASHIKYEDNPAVGNTRFSDAKKQSAYLLKASLLKTGYTTGWFKTPLYGTVLQKANVYED